MATVIKTKQSNSTALVLLNPLYWSSAIIDLFSRKYRASSDYKYAQPDLALHFTLHCP